MNTWTISALLFSIGTPVIWAQTPKTKPASATTQQLNQAVYQELDFSDKTDFENANELRLPEQLNRKFYSRGYYRTVSHDARAQYQLYFGLFDGNPANLNPLPPREAGIKFVESDGWGRASLAQSPSLL